METVKPGTVQAMFGCRHSVVALLVLSRELLSEDVFRLNTLSFPSDTTAYKVNGKTWILFGLRVEGVSTLDKEIFH